MEKPQVMLEAAAAVQIGSNTQEQLFFSDRCCRLALLGAAIPSHLQAAPRVPSEVCSSANQYLDGRWALFDNQNKKIGWLHFDRARRLTSVVIDGIDSFGKRERMCADGIDIREVAVKKSDTTWLEFSTIHHMYSSELPGRLDIHVSSSEAIEGTLEVPTADGNRRLFQQHFSGRREKDIDIPAIMLLRLARRQREGYKWLRR